MTVRAGWFSLPLKVGSVAVVIIVNSESGILFEGRMLLNMVAEPKGEKIVRCKIAEQVGMLRQVAATADA